MNDDAESPPGLQETNGASSRRWLFMAAIGPVQGFIGAARRMRDLHYGSVMLADVACSLALRLKNEHQYKVELVFPSGLPEHSVGGAQARVANKLVAVLNTEAPEHVARDLARELARDLRQELTRKLKTIGDSCKDKLNTGTVGHAVNWQAFEAQMGDALQLYAAWAPSEGNDSAAYRKAYARADELLDARKFTRNFSPNPVGLRGWQLSSLDPARESVLADGSVRRSDLEELCPVSRKAVADLRRRWGLAPGEQLDAVGLCKRVLGTEQGFPALTRVALQPWVETWSPAKQTQLAQGLAPFVALGMARTNACHKSSPLAKLPYDCELLLSSRRAEARRQAERDGGDPAIKKALDELNKLLAPKKPDANSAASDSYGLPDGEAVYVAFLMADGDRLGSLLRHPQSGREHHGVIAKGLQTFAEKAEGLVGEAGGSCFFARGDDVIAVLPVDRAIVIAEKLRLAFSEELKVAAEKVGAYPPTLSVGLAYAHVLEPMGRQRALAAQALQLAKEGYEGQGMRNALGLMVQPRSGAPRAWCGHWVTGRQGDSATEPVPVAKRLECWTQAFESELVSGSLPYDLLKGLDTTPTGAMQAYAQRILQRRMTEQDSKQPELQEWLTRDIAWQFRLSNTQNLVEADARQRLADLLYITRWLATHPRPAGVAVEKEAEHG